MVRLMMCVVLGLILSACTVSVLAPPRGLIEKAVVWQFQQTQTQLKQQLDLDIKNVDIKNIAIAQQRPLSIENLPAFRIQGSYDVVLKLPKRQLSQPHRDFDVYMQLQREGKTWRVLQPNPNDSNPSSWQSFVIE